MPKYLAHVSIRPRTGGDPYTVETEFEASGYPAAWQRVLSMADRFGGTVIGHRLQNIAEGGEVIDVTPRPVSQWPVVSAVAADALTVKAPEPIIDNWYDTAGPSVYCPRPVPYPTDKELLHHDSVA